MKKLFGALVVLTGILVLGACGNGGSSSTGSSSASGSADNQLEAIKAAGVLNVATSADFAPFEFHALIDGKDTIVGADIDMVNEIADRLGVEVNILDLDFNAVLTALQQGKADIAVSGISATYAPELSESAMIPGNSRPKSRLNTPIETVGKANIPCKRPKAINICTSIGVPRMTSIYALANQRKGVTFDNFIRAKITPRIVPKITVMIEITMVITTPERK